MIRLTKRGDISKGAAWAIRIASFMIAIIIGGIIFACMKKSPFDAYNKIIVGAIGFGKKIPFFKTTGFKRTIKIMIALLGTALAIAPCFKMKFWNIGAEGQITMGAIGGALIGMRFVNSMPSWLLLIVMCIFGMVFGAVWALIPAFFKAKWGTNETLFTLMMNYIAIGIAKWLQGGPWEGKPGSQVIDPLSKNARLPEVFGIYCGWIIVIVLTVLMYIYMNYTKQGYEIDVIGQSENTARYAGMNVVWITVRTAIVSGAICGLVGYMLVSGQNGQMTYAIAGGIGFTAITVAWLAQLNPFVMMAISFILAVLEKGSGDLESSMEVPKSVSEIITGIFLFCMLACEFFINYKIIVENKAHKEAVK